MPRLCLAYVFVGVLMFGSAAAWAQAPADGAGSKSKADFWIESGVLKVIPPEAEPAETFSETMALEELAAKLPEWKPNFTYKLDQTKTHKGATLKEMASNVILRRPVWNLEFAFKPLRMIEVDVPQANGKFQRKHLWYMVYRVRNNGYHQGVKAEPDEWNHTTYGVELVNQPIFFFPQFVLQAHTPKVELVSGSRVESYVDKEYLDRIIPAAIQPIAERERVGAKLHDSVSITKQSIPVSDEKSDRSVWGVAIWEDVDPRTDFFSVFAQGLTNAYQFVDGENDMGRKLQNKSLKLNFHRAGDEIRTHEEEFRFGVPLSPDATRQADILKVYQLESPLDYQWVYR